MKKLIGLILVSLMTALTTNAQSKRYDINYDGVVDVTDVMLMVNKILQPDAPDPYERKLTFQVSEKPMNSDGDETGARRSHQIFTKDLDHFFVNMMWDENDGYGMNYSEMSQTHRQTITGYYENNEYWPCNGIGSDNIPVTVFAYVTSKEQSVYTFNEPNSTYTEPYLSVSVEESSDDQYDMLVAKNTRTWANSSGGVVPLLFDHICAAIQFQVQKSSKLVDSNVDVLLQEVVLHNVKSKGKFGLVNGEWLEQSGNSNFTLHSYQNGTKNAITVTNQPQLLGNIVDNQPEYLFLLPQDIIGMEKGTAIADADAEKQAYLELKCKISKGEHYYVGSSAADGYGSVYLPFSANLHMGKILPVTISIGTSIRDANGNSVF
jgi:hypothetical protein